MATTKIRKVKSNAAWLLDYCANPEKTDMALENAVEAALGYAADQDKTERCL